MPGELQALLVALPQPLSVCDCVRRPSCRGQAAAGCLAVLSGLARQVGRPAHTPRRPSTKWPPLMCVGAPAPLGESCFHLLRFFQFGFSQCLWCRRAPASSLELIPRWLACLHAEVASGSPPVTAAPTLTLLPPSLLHHGNCPGQSRELGRDLWGLEASKGAPVERWQLCQASLYMHTLTQTHACRWKSLSK